MAINILIWLILIWCAVKTIGYGIYTLNRKNITGAVSIFILSLLTLSAIAVFI